MRETLLEFCKALTPISLVLLTASGLFLGGLLVGMQSLHRETVRMYELRLKEANFRQEVLAEAVQLLAKDKFEAYAAKVAAMHRLTKETPR